MCTAARSERLGITFGVQGLGLRVQGLHPGFGSRPVDLENGEP